MDGSASGHTLNGARQAESYKLKSLGNNYGLKAENCRLQAKDQLLKSGSRQLQAKTKRLAALYEKRRTPTAAGFDNNL